MAHVTVCLLALTMGSTVVAGQEQTTSTTARTADPTAQTPGTTSPQTASTSSNPIQVNWLYGAFVPKDVPLEPLTLGQRRALFIRQTFLTYGTYVKTAFFAIGDQIGHQPSAWDDTVGGYGERLASRYGQFATQNALSAAGNALLGYEPRYERCRCSGAWPRIRHALVRNFVTYDRTERTHRPQIASYGAAIGAGLITSTWRPGASAWTQAYDSVITQAAFGSFANLIGEFAPEIARMIGRHKVP